MMITMVMGIREDGIPDQGGEQLIPISQDDMIHLRGGSTMNTMGASLNKYFVQSRRLEVESVDKEVWDNTMSQKGGQTVRDAKGVKEQHLDDKEAVVRNRNKTVGQIVEEEAAVQLAPSMGTLEQHT